MHPEALAHTHRTARDVAAEISQRTQRECDAEALASMAVSHAHTMGRPYVHMRAISADTVWLPLQVAANWIARYEKIAAAQALAALTKDNP